MVVGVRSGRVELGGGVEVTLSLTTAGVLLVGAGLEPTSRAETRERESVCA